VNSSLTATVTRHVPGVYLSTAPSESSTAVYCLVGRLYSRRTLTPALDAELAPAAAALAAAPAPARVTGVRTTFTTCTQERGA
jgi:hypothetical protein